MKKTVVPGMYKVTEGIVVNKDNEALQKYKNKKASMQEKDSKINNLESQVEVLTNEMQEIKQLLLRLVTKE